MHRFVILAAHVFGALLFVTATANAEEPPSAVGPLLRLYRSGRLPAERQPTVVAMICERGNEHDLRVIWDKLLTPDAMSPELRLQAMQGIAEAAQGRKVIPAGDLQGLAQLIATDDQAQRLAAVKLAAACRVEPVSPMMREIAADNQADEKLRMAAIEGLVAVGGEENCDVLLKLTHEGPPIAMRMRAAAGLVGTDIDLAARQAALVLATASPQDDPGPMLNAFFQRKEGPDRLAAALKEATLAVDVAKHALRYMYSVGRSDTALSDVLSSAAGIAADTPPPTPEEVAAIVQAVSEKGDAARGERIFRRADLNCMRCHSLCRAGGQVGPDLSAVGGSSPLDYVANSILNPNLAVKEQFVTRVVETSDGLILTGVMVDRDENRLRLRDAQNQVVVIPTADIVTEAEGITLMPSGLTKFLTHDELLDLIKFISELGKPGPYAVQTVPTIQRWQVLAEPPPELTDAVPHLDHIRQYVLGAPPEAWRSAYAKVSGYLPLEELRAGDQPSVLILRGEFHVNEAGPIAVRVECNEPAQTWIDAQPFHDEKEIVATVEPGRHAVIVRVETSSESQSTLRVRLVRPEGSHAQFEVIGGS